MLRHAGCSSLCHTVESLRLDLLLGSPERSKPGKTIRLTTVRHTHTLSLSDVSLEDFSALSLFYED